MEEQIIVVGEAELLAADEEEVVIVLDEGEGDLITTITIILTGPAALRIVTSNSTIINHSSNSRGKNQVNKNLNQVNKNLLPNLHNLRNQTTRLLARLMNKNRPLPTFGPTEGIRRRRSAENGLIAAVLDLLSLSTAILILLTS